MDKKSLIRKKYFNKRKKNYFEVENVFFKPLINILKKNYSQKVKLGLYYPTSYELNVLGLLSTDISKKLNILLPAVDEKNSMGFFDWKKGDILSVNKFGILEPYKIREKVPDIILVPLLAFDKNKNRLGYGKGFYDKYLNKYANTSKNILSIGVAFSFQKHHNLPVNNKDFKLDCIITEKGMVK